MDIASRIVFAIVSIVLVALAFALLGTACILVFQASAADQFGSAVISAIGYVVISLAVFDVAKYLLEEEVLKRSEMRFTGEARRGLTKFISTIAIAVFLEALVLVAAAGKTDISETIYATLLMLVGILIVVGLGLYQYLSVKAETTIGGVAAEVKDEKKVEDAKNDLEPSAN